jgi:hypothetical protein
MTNKGLFSNRTKKKGDLEYRVDDIENAYIHYMKGCR